MHHFGLIIKLFLNVLYLFSISSASVGSTSSTNPITSEISQVGEFEVIHSLLSIIYSVFTLLEKGWCILYNIVNIMLCTLEGL